MIERVVCSACLAQYKHGMFQQRTVTVVYSLVWYTVALVNRS